MQAIEVHQLTNTTSPDSAKWLLIVHLSPYMQEDFFSIHSSFGLQENPT